MSQVLAVFLNIYYFTHLSQDNKHLSTLTDFLKWLEVKIVQHTQV